MPFAAWRQLSREKQKAWAAISGIVVVGSVIKVAYFSFSRGLMVADTERQQREGHQAIVEARSFAAWSKQDRENRLPDLTPEQEREMVQYLRLVESHGWNKAMELNGKGSNDECIGCPFLDKKKARS
jgi:hypothetical protein